VLSRLKAFLSLQISIIFAIAIVGLAEGRELIVESFVILHFFKQVKLIF